MALLGLVLGASATAVTASLVRAGDDAGVRAFHLQEATRRAPSATPLTYAPVGSGWRLPLFGSYPDGRIEHPPVLRERGKPRDGATAGALRATARYDSGSSASRTICVRMCDGYHMPLGHLRSQADWPAHEALCTAMNPGIPVKVFRVPAGAADIDGAVASDGRTYGALPVAYGHEKSSDPGCRPTVPSAGDRRVSLLRDFTLRPGDSVVLDGKVTTFEGSSTWPYNPRNFRDFRSSNELNANQRRMIDDTVGISNREGQMLALRRDMTVQVAKIGDATTIELRGRFESGTGETATASSMRRIVISPES
ncbi:hypothetical protein BIWAKO_04358 [Bosea sp. BIWAKO-01]|nr:hypothetical protein BIWAKO_04358 [Bosea sp. BIWAKO-01]